MPRLRCPCGQRREAMTTETYTCGCEVEDGELSRVCGVHAVGGLIGSDGIVEKVHAAFLDSIANPAGPGNIAGRIAGIMDEYLVAALRSTLVRAPSAN